MKQETINFELNELFNDYDTDTISVRDFHLVFQGVCVDYIHKDDGGSISIWAGNPDTDKFAEELLPEKEDKRLLLELILEYFS